MKEEGIFGLLTDQVDAALNRQNKAYPKLTPKVPGVRIEEQEEVDYLDELPIENQVKVNESDLEELIAKLNLNTEDLSNVMLKHLIPLILSYDAGVNYTKAALGDGLRMDVDFDPGIFDCVKHIGLLSIVSHFTVKSKIPKSIKREFLKQFSATLAASSVERYHLTNKLNDISRNGIDNLRARIVKSGGSEKGKTGNVVSTRSRK